jgi:purine-nucleoside phosphorylase
VSGLTELGIALDFMRQRLNGEHPSLAIILGSGLGALADSVDGYRIPYAEIPGFPVPTVAGHSGELVVGQLEGVPTVLQSGRFHLYEGHEPGAVVLPVRLFAKLGVELLIITNAAGGINRAYRPPTLMLIADHINLMWKNPLVGPVASDEHRWPDLYGLYDQEMRSLAREVAAANRISLEEGVYAGVLGPSYETPAEVSMLERLGADAVGMSTVPEAITARARGIRVLGISSITNVAAGLSSQKLQHEEVLEAGRQIASDLEALIRGVVRAAGR